MKRLTDSLTNMAVVLTLIAVITGGILAYVNHITEGPIKEKDEQALENGIKSVMNDPNAIVANTVDTTLTLSGAEKPSKFTIYNINNADGEEAGVAVKSTTTDVTDLGDCLIIIRNVPCYKCTECNEIMYTGDVIRKLDAIIAKAKQTLNEISVIDYEKNAA